jgi:hypothetical protein
MKEEPWVYCPICGALTYVNLNGVRRCYRCRNTVPTVGQPCGISTVVTSGCTVTVVEAEWTGRTQTIPGCSWE